MLECEIKYNSKKKLKTKKGSRKTFYIEKYYLFVVMLKFKIINFYLSKLKKKCNNKINVM